MGFRERLGQVRGSRRAPAVARPSRSMGDRLHVIAWSLALIFGHLSIWQGYVFHVSRGFDQLETSGVAAFPLLSVVTACLLATAVVIVRPERLARSRLVATSVAWTVVLLLALMSTWYLIDHEVRPIEGAGRTVATQADVDRYLAAHAL